MAAERSRTHDVAAGVLTFLTLYEGAVPLVARGLFGADQRFAPALWLPAPWWWIACLAIVVAGGALLLLIHRTQPHAGPEAAPDAPSGTSGEAVSTAHEGTGPDGRDTSGYDAASAVVLLAGIYNGVAPLVSRWFFDGDLLLAFTLRLPSPWWWVASACVIVATAVALGMIDRAKERAVDREG
jgi:hypothetical protein